ncbi:MAG: helix-turn-helix transcriptional regulator [Acutalibacter sp.]|nr:helix-turn-helix transcriptional regulator [Acutalibacter sp.]MCI8921475.1 helix-turn-helix transcriptional regulator [Acutalibacter sp.]
MIFLFLSRPKDLRQSMNLHQEALARLLNVDRSTISSYERDMRHPLRHAHAERRRIWCKHRLSAGKDKAASL